MESYLDAAVAQIRQFEGSIAWMYLDTVGKVTVGVGLMLPAAAAATALPFRVADKAATQAEIAADFARVSTMPSGHAAIFYRTADSPLLSDAAISEHLRGIVVSLDQTLAAALPVWTVAPTSAKLALLDMAYNLGAHGLLHGFPKLVAAVEAQHWALAATLCQRHGPNAARNDWTHEQFLQSVASEMRAEAAEARHWLVQAAGRAWGRLRQMLHLGHQ